MERTYWKPANMLNPAPAALICSMDEDGRRNIMTAAWAGTVCSDPVMISVSIRPERYSYGIIERTGEFVLSLTNRKLAYATDLCGVRSGRDLDKFAHLGLTEAPSRTIRTPGIAESPVNLECRVRQMIPLGTHTMFLAEVTGVNVDSALLDERGRLQLDRADLLSYVHGEYFTLGEKVGKFGYSVRKRKDRHRDRTEKPQKDTKNGGSRRGGGGA